MLDSISPTHEKAQGHRFLSNCRGTCPLPPYRLSHSPQVPGDQRSHKRPLPSAIKVFGICLQSGRLNPGPCISVTGTVEEIRKETDGDVHILFRLDQQFESLLNEKNIFRQHGDLVLEPICQGKVRQADAAEPCSRYDGPHFEPEIGHRYLVSGAYVHDADHGWNELHPVTSIQSIE